MSDVLKLKNFLIENVDKYRILYSQKKEIKYSKLIDGKMFSNNHIINYKVYVMMHSKNYSIESSDVMIIIKSINTWLSSSIFTEEVTWFDNQRYKYQSKNNYIENKRTFDTFDFQNYQVWLDKISDGISIQNSFLYYGEVELLKLFTNKVERTQYLTRSQILCYDINNNIFLLNKDNVFINNYIGMKSEENLRKKIESIDTLFKEDEIRFLEIKFEDLSHIISVALNHFKGENIIGLNSIFNKDSIEKSWLNDGVNITLNSNLSFDNEGLPKQQVSIIEKGVIKNFLNTSYSMAVLGSNICGFSDFNLGDYGCNNDIIYNIKVKNKVLKDTCLNIKIDTPVLLFDKDDVKIQLSVFVERDYVKYEGNVIVNFKDLMNHLFEVKGKYIVAKDVLKIVG